MRILRSLMLPATILIVGGGCATGSHIDRNKPDDVTITVQNNGWTDIRVYMATASGFGRRLMFVTALSTVSRDIPYSQVSGSSVRLRATALGNREEVLSPEVNVFPGDLVSWEILPLFQSSGMTLYTQRGP